MVRTAFQIIIVVPFNLVRNAYQIGKASLIKLELLDVQGKVVVQLLNGPAEAGTFQITLHRDQLTAGVYLLQMITGESIVTKKVVIE